MRGQSRCFLPLVLCLAILVMLAAIACSPAAESTPIPVPPTEAPLQITDAPVHVTEAPSTAPPEETSETPEPSPACSVEEPISDSLVAREPGEAPWHCEPWGLQTRAGSYVRVKGSPAYVSDQVIVTGREKAVEKVAETVYGLGKPQFTLTLDWIPDGVLARFPAAQGEPVIISIYGTDGKPALDVAQGLSRTALDEDAAVYTDLNLVSGHPHIAAGSPHIAAGSSRPDPAEAKQGFAEQWAFSSDRGIGLGSLAWDAGTITPAVKSVRVGVFDTSPFDRQAFWEVPWVTAPQELCVVHPLVPTSALTETADHGLYVAGLIRAVAPSSEIHLVRVLGDGALGELGLIIQSLDWFIRDSLGDTDPNTAASSTVINLSFGFPLPRHIDPDDDGLTALRTVYKSLIRQLQDTQQLEAPWAYLEDELPVVSLETILLGAAARDITVVAAAGNESNTELIAPSEVPASYQKVIGVAASNASGLRACFSNQGDIAAPGGDVAIEGSECARAFSNAEKQAVIGPAMITAPCAGYAYWAGTSFAAPLVSGLAARILGENQYVETPEQVREEITTYAVTSPDPDLEDIIRVPQTP